MYKRALAALSLGFGLSLAFSSASCGPTCPAGQQSCGDSNASGSGAGAGGGSNPATCEMLTAMQNCMDAFCKTATNPYCGCYKNGRRDLTTAGCTCIAFDAQAFCENAKGIDAASYDCAAASSGVASYCVPVN